MRQREIGENIRTLTMPAAAGLAYAAPSEEL